MDQRDPADRGTVVVDEVDDAVVGERRYDERRESRQRVLHVQTRREGRADPREQGQPDVGSG